MAKAQLVNIRRSFGDVQGALTDSNLEPSTLTLEITETTLIALGKTLGLETLAEGIEDPAQLEILKYEQCDLGRATCSHAR